jgi:hypothetical protein
MFSITYRDLRSVLSAGFGVNGVLAVA